MVMLLVCGGQVRGRGFAMITKQAGSVVSRMVAAASKEPNEAEEDCALQARRNGGWNVPRRRSRASAQYFQNRWR